MKKYCSIVILLLVLFSCKKKDEFIIGKDILLNYSDSHSWKLVKITVDGKETVIPTCEQDNVLTLFKDDKFSVDEGSVKCGEKQLSEEGFWRISDDNKDFHLLSTTKTSIKEAKVTNFSTTKFSFSETKDGVITEWFYEAK